MKNDRLNFWKSYLFCELSTEYYDSKEWKTDLIRFSGPPDTSVFVNEQEVTKVQGR